MTSALARVEVVRAVVAGGAGAVAHAHRQLARLYQVELTRDVLDDAASLLPGTQLRSLDALHLAAARVLGADLRAIITYDRRMSEAATAAGLPCAGPA